jgi:hypothetical protein
VLFRMKTPDVQPCARKIEQTVSFEFTLDYPKVGRDRMFAEAPCEK